MRLRCVGISAPAQNFDFSPAAVYLHNDSVQLRLGIKGTAQAGFGALTVSCLTFETRAALLGISAQLPQLARRP
jgi:hypothetical protein